MRNKKTIQGFEPHCAYFHNGGVAIGEFCSLVLATLILIVQLSSRLIDIEWDNKAKKFPHT